MSARRAVLALGFAVLSSIAAGAAADAACSISTTAVSFGSYDVFSTFPLDSTGNVTYQCGSKDKNISVTLDRGGAPTFAERRMLKGTEELRYNLYRDAARTTIWGDGTGGTQAYSDPNPPNATNVTVTIYGRVPAGQDVSAGTYTNTITATIIF
jgi:spore coat protein U-like protein